MPPRNALTVAEQRIHARASLPWLQMFVVLLDSWLTECRKGGWYEVEAATVANLPMLAIVS